MIAVNPCSAVSLPIAIGTSGEGEPDMESPGFEARKIECDSILAIN